MSLPGLSWGQVCARRLERHGLARPAPDTGSAGIADVVAAICGAHAQLLSAGELSVAPDVRMTPEQTDAVVAGIATVLADAELTVEELVLAGGTEPPAGSPRGVRLLPYVDAYAVGSHPRDRLFPGRAAERALAGSQAGNFPVLLVDGTVAGVWHQRTSGRRVDLTVEPLGTLSAARLRELTAQADRVAEILGGTATLTIGPVTVGAHA